MLDCLDDEMLFFLPQALLALLPSGCDVSDISDVLRLLNNLMIKFTTRLDDLLQQLLPPLVTQCASYAVANMP